MSGEITDPSATIPMASGGSGGFSGGRADTSLILKAIRQRWAIPDELRETLPGVLAHVLADPQTSVRDKIAASKAVLSADALNMEQEKRDAGGDTLNVNVLTPEDRERRRKELEERGRQRRLAAESKSEPPAVE